MASHNDQEHNRMGELPLGRFQNKEVEPLWCRLPSRWCREEIQPLETHLLPSLAVPPASWVTLYILFDLLERASLSSLSNTSQSCGENQ